MNRRASEVVDNEEGESPHATEKEKAGRKEMWEISDTVRKRIEKGRESQYVAISDG